jgi:hypothetical protein
MEMERDQRELRHFLHDEHPLIFNEEVKEDHIGGKHCDGCYEKLSGPNYSCKDSYCGFIIHKSCAELPRELEHPLHPKHPLLLIYEEYFLKREIKCEGCNREEELWGLIYHCSHCNFSLDTKCASLPLTVQAEIHHEHPLTLMRKSLSFTCCACGEEGKGMFTCVLSAHSWFTCNVIPTHCLSNISVTATLFTSPIPLSSLSSINLTNDFAYYVLKW